MTDGWSGPDLQTGSCVGAVPAAVEALQAGGAALLFLALSAAHPQTPAAGVLTLVAS